MVLIDSAPPARMSARARPSSCAAACATVAASATASMPEAQLRWTVSAGTCCGTPAHSAATRAGLAASTGMHDVAEDHFIQPVGGRGRRDRAPPAIATRARSVTWTLRNAVPALASGVRTPATTAAQPAVSCDVRRWG